MINITYTYTYIYIYIHIIDLILIIIRKIIVLSSVDVEQGSCLGRDIHTHARAQDSL